MKRLVLLVAVLGFTFLFTGAAFGDILNVPTAEYPTIQDAIDAASSGDTVEVAAGTYSENITMKSGVVIQGAGQGISIIDGGASGSVVTAIGVDSSATLDGFTITGASGAAGMYNQNSSLRVTNCTFSGNSATAGGGMLSGSNSSPILTNCILWGDSPEEIYNLISSPSVTYSDIQGDYTGTGNINADPLFADPDGPDNIPGNEDDNYHLSAGSPCIDAGTSSGAPDTDLEGNPRPQGSGYDMGAYEFLLAKTTAMPWILLLLGD